MAVGLTIAGILLPACSAEDTRAEVTAYFAVKASYGVEVRRRHVAIDSPYHAAAMKDLETRLRRIIRPDSIGASRLTPNLEHLFLGEEGSNGLDGLVGRMGTARILITTPELIVGWMEARGDSASDPYADLKHEDILTWVFDDGAHAYRFADLSSKASLPAGTFLVQMVDRTNGDPTGAREIIAGIRRGSHVYLILDKARTLVSLPECGAAWRDEYRSCFDGHVASHPDFPRIVAHVRGLISSLPYH